MNFLLAKNLYFQLCGYYYIMLSTFWRISLSSTKLFYLYYFSIHIIDYSEYFFHIFNLSLQIYRDFHNSFRIVPKFFYIWHVMVRYGKMGVKQSARNSGMQSDAIKYLLNIFYSLKCQKTDFQNFPLYFSKFLLYNVWGLSWHFPCNLRLEILHIILYMVEEWDKLCC